jgi:hypothetical protein
MPFQVVTAVYLDLRGPAHFHVDDGIDEHDHGHSHFHGRDGIERHHHPAADESVVAVENAPMPDSHALEEGAPSGWSATMCVALVSAGPSLQLPRPTDGIVPGPETLLQTRFPARLERPPRHYRA